MALLARLGRHREALDALARLLPSGVQTSGFAPTMIELARLSGDYDRLMEACRERNDLLSYTAGLVERAAKASVSLAQAAIDLGIWLAFIAGPPVLMAVLIFIAVRLVVRKRVPRSS